MTVMFGHFGIKSASYEGCGQKLEKGYPADEVSNL
jgi:hypothetical protein